MSEVSIDPFTDGSLADPVVRAAYGGYWLQYEMALALVAVRLARGLTQAELAAQAGVPLTSVVRLELGEANPRLRELGALFACLGSTVSVTPQPLNVGRVKENTNAPA